MPHPSLAQLQTWFQAVMSSPAPLEYAIAAARRVHGMDEQALKPPAPEESPLPGLQIYARGYWLRLLECLRADYPGLAKMLGDDLFNFFARSYLQSNPSTSPTLYDLGAGLPAFLERTQPKDTPEDERIQMRFVLDLARVERAVAEVTRGKGLEGMPASCAPDLLAYLKAADTVVRPSPCLRLLRLSFPLKPFLQAIHQAREDVEIPAETPTVIALSRVNYRIQMAELK